MKNLLFILLLLVITPPLKSQNVPTPAIQTMINAELTKRGLNEAEVKARLLKNGIDIENIPPAELPTYQARITAVLDEMEKEKKAAAGNATKVTTPTTVVTVIPTVNGPKEPATTKEEAIAEAGQKVAQKAAAQDNPGAIYGHSLFTDQSLDVFRTTDGSRAPDTYILGAGDEIRISIFGASQTDMQLPVNSQGFIQPTGMPKIFLQGLSLLQARKLLQERFSSSYTFNSDQFALTIASARTIMVNVFGESKLTGGFNLSALNSAFNALSAAGGVTNIGSVRAIQLIRGNERKTIDLYAFMNDPTIQFKFDLQQNDILFVPVAQELVRVEGAVKRPMRYEMLPNETLASLIKFAGGINENTYADFVQIERISNGEVRLQEWNLTDVLSGKTVVPLQNGDIIRTKAIGKPIEQFVDISGSLFYPGRFDLTANPTLDILLKNAQPTPQAKLDLIFVERIRKDLTIERFSVNYNNLRDSNKTFQLYPRDKVAVTELANFRDVASISVTGHVRAPFEKSFAITDHLTVKQAIEMAGGLKIDFYPIAYILRYNLLNPKEKKYLRLELATSNDYVLLPGDQLMIFDKNTFTETNRIAVAGFVRSPFEQTFTFTDRVSIKNALELAGGLKAGASNVAYIFRRDLLVPQRMQYIRIELDKSENILLQPGDQLNVYDSSLYINNGEVQVSGAIKTPRSFIYDSSLTIPDILTACGGFTLGAAFNKIEVFRTHISPKEPVKLEVIKLEVDSTYKVLTPAYFTLQPYDYVVVRLTPGFTMGRYIEITGEIAYPGIYQLDTKQTQLSAIINRAGGLLPSADAKGSRLFRTYNNRGSITIDVKKAINHSGNKRIDPILFEGDIININRLENTITIESTGTRLRQEGGASLNIVYQGNHSAKWYVKNYAGGFIKDADKKSVTVTLKNGQMKSTKSILWLFKKYPQVETGATVSMHLKPPKEPKVANEKMNWNDFWNRTLAATTAIFTLLILSKQL
ncbi:MAG: SLBB domain-containing protein [Bacteroidia bacterium]|nr:SLBB domain-containing protein [Bacteroidia bacterium]